MIYAFYREQSTTSSPGIHANYLQDLLKDITQLCALTQGLILHYADADYYKHERSVEIDAIGEGGDTTR